MPHPIRDHWETRPRWSEFGAWRASGGHKGFDYYCPEGTTIYGTHEGGRVAKIAYNGNIANGFGHNITVVYPGSVVVVDAHMRGRSPLEVGDSVGIWTALGEVGKTGNAWATIWKGLRHDHHQITVRGVLVDPIQYYQSLAGDEGSPIPPVRRFPKVLSITRVIRKGVGEHIMFASPTQVSLTRELSTAPKADRDFWFRVAGELARAAGYGENYTIPTFDDSPNGGWYVRDQIANRIAGMPAGFPLSEKNPYDPLGRVQGGGGQPFDPAAILTAIAEVPAATRAAIVRD